MTDAPVAVTRSTGGWIPLAAVIVSVVLWSTTYGLSAIALVSASPAVLSELRLVLSVPLLLALILFLRPSRGAAALRRALRQPRSALLALTGVALFYLPSNIGLTLSTAGTASLMSASLPVLTALIAWWVIRERISGRIGLGLALVTVGVGIGSAGVVELGLGAALLVAGLASYALYTVLLRRTGAAADPRAETGTSDPLVLATATAVWGAVLLLPWLWWELATGAASWPTGAPAWLSVAFLALIVTGPTMALYSYGAERVPATVAGTATGAVPALGYAFAVLLGEPLIALKAAGAALTVVGVLIAAAPARQRPAVIRPRASVPEPQRETAVPQRETAVPQKEGAAP
ncbi:MAG: DMT family transporter [Candidatus Microbacterium colombiense]|nr:MAG: DMT family transporter [Microbacterium sp.]